MPNWCDNTVTIEYKGEGDCEKALDDLKAKMVRVNEKGEDELAYDILVPEPNGDEEGWFDWRCDNWGTKWISEIYDTHTDEGKLVIHFTSAWSPPEAYFEKVAKLYPDYIFTHSYEEDGCNFFGYSHFQGNKASNFHYETPDEECSILYKKQVKEDKKLNDDETSAWRLDGEGDGHCDVCDSEEEEEEEEEEEK